jgi:hypothetical protein
VTRPEHPTRATRRARGLFLVGVFRPSHRCAAPGPHPVHLRVRRVSARRDRRGARPLLCPIRRSACPFPEAGTGPSRGPRVSHRSERVIPVSGLPPSGGRQTDRRTHTVGGQALADLPAVPYGYSRAACMVKVHAGIGASGKTEGPLTRVGDPPAPALRPELPIQHTQPPYHKAGRICPVHIHGTSKPAGCQPLSGPVWDSQPVPAGLHPRARGTLRTRLWSPSGSIPAPRKVGSLLSDPQF